MRTKRGQALLELACGMFTLALLIGLLTIFARYIVRSLEIQNHLRGANRGVSDKIELDAFAAESIFGSRNLHIKEPFSGSSRSIQ